jgi:hypothetical protein
VAVPQAQKAGRVKLPDAELPFYVIVFRQRIACADHGGGRTPFRLPIYFMP